MQSNGFDNLCKVTVFSSSFLVLICVLVLPKTKYWKTTLEAKLCFTAVILLDGVSRSKDVIAIILSIDRIIFKRASYICMPPSLLCSPKKFLVELSWQYRAPMKITFAGNHQKFDYRPNFALHIFFRVNVDFVLHK